MGALLFLVGVILLITHGWEIVVVVASVLYPSLCSIKALESKGRNDEDKVWLCYWLIFGVYHVVETFFWYILYFIPYFSWIKLGVFGWLLLP